MIQIVKKPKKAEKLDHAECTRLNQAPALKLLQTVDQCDEEEIRCRDWLVQIADYERMARRRIDLLGERRRILQGETDRAKQVVPVHQGRNGRKNGTRT